MPDDIVKIEPSAYGVTLDVKALLRWLRRRGKPDRVALAAERFVKLFEEHKVAVTQIQHFLPQLTPDKFQQDKPEALLAALTPDVIKQAADLFRVRRSWLEGVDDQIYERAWCYQVPEEFFIELAAVPRVHDYVTIRGLRCTETLDYRDPNPQQIALLLVERIRELGDVEIFRYRIFGDGWDWNYPKSRIQLKAMIRIVEDLGYGPVPLDLVKPSIVEEVREGRLIPRAYVRRSPHSHPSLEDYVCTPAEHAQAKECDELPYVHDYIKRENLVELARQELFKP